MASTQSQGWFLLAADGQKVGPFTADDLQRLIQSGKVHPQNRAVAADSPADPVTVAEALHLSAIARGGADSSRLPPRPDSDVTNPAIQLQIRPDPALDLIDVLQSVRERQTNSPAQRNAGGANDLNGLSVRGAPIADSPNLPVYAGLAVLAIVAVWGASRMFGGSASTPSPAEPRAIVAAPKTVAPVTPPATSATRIAPPVVKAPVRAASTLFRPAALTPSAHVQTRAAGALEARDHDDRETRERESERERDREVRERDFRGDSRDHDPREGGRDSRAEAPRDREPGEGAKDGGGGAAAAGGASAAGDWSSRNPEGGRVNGVNGAMDIAPAPAPAAPPRGGGAEREGEPRSESR